MIVFIPLSEELTVIIYLKLYNKGYQGLHLELQLVLEYWFCQRYYNTTISSAT